MELKEVEEKYLKESERLEKEVAKVKEVKVNIDFIFYFLRRSTIFHVSLTILVCIGLCANLTKKDHCHDCKFEKHPELKKKFNDEIRNDYWCY